MVCAKNLRWRSPILRDSKIWCESDRSTCVNRLFVCVVTSAECDSIVFVIYQSCSFISHCLIRLLPQNQVCDPIHTNRAGSCQMCWLGTYWPKLLSDALSNRLILTCGQQKVSMWCCFRRLRLWVAFIFDLYHVTRKSHICTTQIYFCSFDVRNILHCYIVTYKLM